MAIEPLFYQNGQVLTQFNGEHVAHVSSELPSKERHTEFDLFITEFDEWVLQGVGRSRVPGEIDRYWVVISDDPADILSSILDSKVSRLAKKLLVESFNHLAECVCD